LIPALLMIKYKALKPQRQVPKLPVGKGKPSHRGENLI
jgi:hypothetical protein